MLALVTKQMGLNMFFHCQGENPFSGNPDEQDPEDSMVMEVSEQELTSEAADGQTEEAPVVKNEGETEQEGAAGEVAAAEKDVKMEDEEQQIGIEGEEEKCNEEEEEGFEVGEDEEGYVVRDEIGEEGLQVEPEDEGIEATEVEEEDNRDEWLLAPSVWLLILDISLDQSVTPYSPI